jgi:ribosomal protein S13
MRYSVKYVVANVIASSIVTVDGIGDSIDKDIATKLSINPSQILKKSRDFGALRQIIEDEDLLIILSILEATHLSGAKTLEQSLVDTVLDLYPKNRNLKNQTQIWSLQGLSLTQMLSLMNVDQVIVILLQTGNAGNMSQAFKEAKKYFKSSNEVAGIYKANILPNVAFSAVSMSLILGMSFMLADPYNKIIQVKKIAEPITVTLINFIVNNIGSIVFILVMAIALLVFSFINQKALNKLKKMQPWRGVGDLQDLKSIVNFLPIYATLKRINYLDIDVVNFYKQIQKNIGNELVNYIGKGQSLSQAIVNTSISNKLSKQMSVIFEIENQNIRSEIVESMIEALNLQIKKQAKKISALMLATRNAIVLLSISFFIGVYATGLSL